MSIFEANTNAASFYLKTNILKCKFLSIDYDIDFYNVPPGCLFSDAIQYYYNKIFSSLRNEDDLSPVSYDS